MITSLTRSSCFVACSVGILLLSGCGPRVPKCYPTQGMITVQGKPIAGAMIMLHPQGSDAEVQKLRPYGTTDYQGRFTINGLTQGDGAPAGSYLVTIVWTVADPTSATMPSEDPESAVVVPDRLGGKYSDPQKSGLQATINVGTNELPTFAL